MVIRGTSSKKSQRDFVPSTHPGTHELVLSTEKQFKKVCLEAFYQYLFLYKLSAAKSGNGSLCIYDLTPLADRIGPWNMHVANMIVKER